MGTGYHGRFGNSHGAKEQDNIPINLLKDVRYNKKKIEDYLLNINHPKGGSKAKFMKDVLGYSFTDSKFFS